MSQIILYWFIFFDNEAIKVAKSLKPSKRGVEITDVNKFFLKKKKHAQYLSRGFAWLDTGTFESF